MSEREIARELKVSHMSVNRAVKELFDINFLKVSRAGNINLWELNKGSYSERALSAVLMDGVNAVNPLEELKKVLRQGLKGSGAGRAVLYGSIAKGKERPGSDIDLLLVVDDRDAAEKAVERLEMECIKKFGNPLSAHILSEKEYEEKKGLAVIKDADTGIVII
jgi:predicted nucleotidyltransferase